MQQAEQARLRALDAARVWETPSEPRFDDIAMLAALLGQARIGLVSFVGGERQWFKARHGTQIVGTTRELSLCDEVVRTGAAVVAEDLRSDERFRDHPLLAADPRIGFYAGYPVGFDGQVIGTVCVVDEDPRSVSGSQRDGLRALASQVEALLELRRQVARTESTERRLQRLELLTRNALDVYLFLDGKGQVVDANERALDFYGYTRDEITRLSVRDLRASADAMSVQQVLDSVTERGARFETVHRKKDGSTVEVDVSVASIAARDRDTDEDGERRALLFTTVRDVHARVEHERALERAKTAAEEANRLKSRFLRNMSHELRTPLNAVLGFARVLQRERHGTLTPEQGSYVRDMVDGGEHMLRLVNDLLDLQWVEEGRARLDRRPVSPRTMGEDAARLVRQLAAERDQQISVSFVADAAAHGEGELSVRVDRGRMVQVLVNLLSNAIKFTAPGGHIRLSIEATRSAATFAVEDEGIGISADDQPRVFEEFARVGDTAHSRGLGLGLALSKRLVEEHGGTIRLTSALGVGSRFVVTVPREEPGAS